MTSVLAPPAPKSLAEFRSDPIAFLRRLSREGGDMAHFLMARRRFVLVSHPDAIREVLVTRQSSFVKGPGLLRAEPLLGGGLLTSDGADHRRQRRQLQPTFSPANLDKYLAVMGELAGAMRDEWGDGETRDAHREMSRLTLEIAVRTLFGEGGVAGCPHFAGDNIGDAITDAIFTRFGKLTNEQAPPEKSADRQSPSAVLESAVDRLLQRHAAEDDTLLALLFQDTGRTPEVQDAERRDQAMTFLIAGHESVSVALSWAWFLLSRHPEAEERFHREIDGWDGEDLPALAVTRAVIAETMRLYPPAWMMSREAREPVTIGGEMVEAGTIAVVAPCVTHHDARFFPAPEAFCPERWLAAQTWPRFAYFPFGAGARKCIGDEFAWREMTLLMATLGREWRLRPEPGAPTPDPQPIVTLRPRGGMPMRLTRRRFNWTPTSS
ncbi:cytochrome P450 [Capsulimonas corticalis]|uniref:Cytochrome P450 n=2 Tax=Capsulimonas corticalis TaxID=2219043 RepID=A0A402CZ51_9BACT|nr:cytochrome P450 [Capsulimonas corticalis]